MDKSKSLIESFDRKLLSGILVLILLLTMALLEVTPSHASEAGQQNTLCRAAQHFIKVGTEQYQRSLFTAAELSFRRARIFEKYLPAVEREQLYELLEKARIAGAGEKQVLADTQVEQSQLVKSKPYIGSVKDSGSLTIYEWEQLEKRRRRTSSQPSEQKKQTVEMAESTVVNNQVKVVPSRRVALVPGDLIEVRFFYTPELDVTQTVRPDGKIVLQLVGEVMAQGKSPAELRDELLTLFTSHLKVPDITVIVKSFYDRRVFVGGQVMRSGIVQMPGKMTLLEAIMEAGGFNLREAEVKNVVVIRHKAGQRYGYKLDLKASLAGKKTKPFFLEPKDIIYVPRTKIAVLDQWIDQHINKLIPQTGFVYTTEMGDGRAGFVW